MRAVINSTHHYSLSTTIRYKVLVLLKMSKVTEYADVKIIHTILEFKILLVLLNN